MSTQQAIEPVGLCGLGNMGSAIAQCLAGALSVLAYDPVEARRDVAAQLPKVTIAARLADMRQARLVVLSLPDPAISLEVCATLAEVLSPGAVVIETSTVTPQDVHRCAEVLAGRSIGLVDAAIISGVPEMASGNGALLTGGSDAHIGTAEPVLSILGPTRDHFGELGQGMAVKVINNAVAHAVMVLLAEAFVMGRASGVDPIRLADLLARPNAGLMRPLTYRLRERALNGQYDGGMPMDAARKDSLVALAMAHENGIPLFVINAAHTVYDIAVPTVGARQDYSAVVRLWEQWTGRQLSDLGATA